MKYMNRFKEYFETLSFSGSSRAFTEKLCLFVGMLLLSSCGVPPGAPECVNEDEWGNIESREIIVHANEQFTYSGISVLAGEDIKVDISGVIDLCSGDRVFKGQDYNLKNENGLEITEMHGIDPRNPSWQRLEYTPLSPPGARTPMEVGVGDKLSMLVKGNYDDRTGTQREGEGLYVYIGEDAPPNDVWWYGAVRNTAEPGTVCDPTVTPGTCSFIRLAGSDGATTRDMCDPSAPDADIMNTCIMAPELETNRKAYITSDFPQFFELFDNGTVGDNAGGFKGTAAQDGHIWMKYARTAEARGLDNSGDERFSPWLGKYAWSGGDIPFSGKCFACGLGPIATRCIPVAWLGMYQVCVTASIAACGAAGRLQEFPGAETALGKKCREHPWSTHANKDHWVDNEYDGGNDDGNADDGNNFTGDNPNDGGYEIAIGQGCIGTFGEHMHMRLGPGQATIENQTTPEGCSPVNPGVCDLVIDGWSGLPVQYVKYTVGTGDQVNMDMRPEAFPQPPPPALPTYPAFYKGPGKYEAPLPGAGVQELWFEIRDNTISPLHPQPGYYGDNFGSYKVKIRTTKVSSDFSDFTQKIINPIKGMIFGYCRANTVNYTDANGNPQTTYISKEQLDYSIDEATCNTIGSYTTEDGMVVSTDPVFRDMYGDVQEWRDNTGATTGHVIEAWHPGIAERMYLVLVGSGGVLSYDGVTVSPFLNILRAVLILYIILYSFRFMLGMVNDDYGDFLKRIIKMSIISVLFIPDSWDFFNNFLFRLFVDGVDDLIFLLSGDFTGHTLSSDLYDSMGSLNTGFNPLGAVPDDFSVFKFTDITIDTLFNKATWIKIAGLLFASPVGFIYIILILFGMVIFILAIFKAMILYLLANLAIALLLIVAPIFLTFMLFDRTRPLFDGWIKNLINYTLQPVLVVTALAIFNVFVYSAIYSLLYYRVCWDTVWNLDVTVGGIININRPLFNFYLPSAEGANSPQGRLEMPIQFFMMLIYLIILTALLNFVKWMADLTSELMFGSTVGSLASAAGQTLNKFAGYGKAAITMGTSAAMGAAKGFASGNTAAGKVGRGALGALNGGIIKPITKNFKK